MTWLVTGGAGYIGAHIVRHLVASGREVVVLDDLSSGHRQFVGDGAGFPPTDPHSGVRLIEGSVVTPSDVDAALRATRDGAPVTGVVHCAGYKYAGESVKRPLHSYRQNVVGTQVLVERMLAAGVGNLVFSSSAGVYGTPDAEVVTESTPTLPESPYGETKLVGEWLLRDVARVEPLVQTSLRYFNVVGSGYDDLYDTSPHNLFPVVLQALTDGRTPHVWGTDYPTPDGSCVRDYVHVSDVAAAHVAAAAAMEAGTGLEPVYNLGSGDGLSVLQIMAAVRRVTGIDFEPELRERRPGDPARIIADGTLARRDLGWEMRHDIDTMVRSAWQAWTTSRKDPAGAV